MDENFLLPKTEAAVNAIIYEFARFFDAARIGLQAIYVLYLALRLYFMRNYVELNIAILILSVAQLVLILLDFLGKFDFDLLLQNILRGSKLLATFFMLVLFLTDTFFLTDEIQFWQAATFAFMAVGWILALTGIVFSLTIPRYARMILEGFKSDIEVSGLAGRSFERAKHAAASAAREALDNADVRGAAKAAAGTVGIAVAAKIVSKIFKHHIHKD